MNCLVTCLGLFLLVAPAPAQEDLKASTPGIEVDLSAKTESGKVRLQWSPKGAAVPLEIDDGFLRGSFVLGPADCALLNIRLEKSKGSEHYDRLLIDRNRNGKFGADELLTTKPKEQRHKIWSSFSTTVSVPVPGKKKSTTRPYPMNLWFVVDPSEPAEKLLMRWSRRGWHQGVVELDGIKAHVLITEMQMDGVFNDKDSWALAADEQSLFSSRSSRSLQQHAWLDESAYRVTRIDPHGREILIEAFNPGITRAEEEKRDDRFAADRNAERAKQPLEFSHEFAKAEAEARAAGKRLFIDFETTWCGPCKSMDRWVYSAQKVVSAAAGDIVVKVDGDEHRDLVKRFGVTAYPTMVLLSPEGVEIRRARGYQSVKDMVKFFK